MGAKTGESAWVDWEIWYSLNSYYHPSNSRRRFKPKGLLAVYLPVINPNIPKRLKENIKSGYAEQIYWDDLATDFSQKIEAAYQLRENKERIRNALPLRDDPRRLFN